MAYFWHTDCYRPTIILPIILTKKTLMKNAFLFASLLMAAPALAQEDIDMNINMGGMGIDMNMNVNVRTSTTTTGNVHMMDPGFAPAPAPTHYVMPGYSGPIGCPWPMDQGQFAGAKGSIASRTFEDSRLTMAKQIVGANCLTAGQVRDLMLLMTFEESRLDLAKFSYARTYDLGNYYMLNDAFTFEMSIDELNEFIHGGY
jgi:hypothetical protein